MTVVFNAHRSHVHVVVSYCLFTLSFALEILPSFSSLLLSLSLPLSPSVVILFYLVQIILLMCLGFLFLLV